MIKTCIKYNGEFAKKFKEFTDKYADVITASRPRVQHKHDIEGVFVPTSFYFDIKLGEVLYNVIAVGDYGYGLCPYIVPKSFPKNCRTHKLTYVEDVNGYRMPDFGHPGDAYEGRIIPGCVTRAEIIQDRVSFDKKKFMSSPLYGIYMNYRDHMSDALGVVPKEVFTTTELCNFLATFPEEPAAFHHIDREIQEDLIEIWEHYDCRS